MDVKAIIFDMDGLMIDSENVTFNGYMIEAKKRNIHFDFSFYQKLLGRNIKEIRNIFYNQYGHDFDLDGLINDVHTYVNMEFEKEIPLKKGLLNILAYCKENHLKTIVATSSGRARVNDILSKANLLNAFDDTICGDEVTHGKPNPEIFLSACEKLKVKVNEAIVLEDSEMGILAAFNADIRCICVPDMKIPDEEYKSKTYAICKDLDEVITLIK